VLETKFQIPNTNPVIPLSKPAPPQAKPKAGAAAASFQEVLQKKLDQSWLKFSAHAQKRMAANGINLSESEMAKLTEAVDKVEAKGGRESLILMRDMAFVVSVKNRTVITAINHERLRDNVFTNIDSAVIS
jgi:flagellar operon protein